MTTILILDGGSRRLASTIALHLASRDVSCLVVDSVEQRLPSMKEAVERIEALRVAPEPWLRKARNKAQWKSEIHGRKRP